jgi:hypothetical protein
MEKTEIEMLAEALVGYRGVGGRYDREDDEGYGKPRNDPSWLSPVEKEAMRKKIAGQPVKMVAKFPGRCAQSGAAIEPGDTVQFNPQTRTRILIQKAGK